MIAPSLLAYQRAFLAYDAVDPSDSMAHALAMDALDAAETAWRKDGCPIYDAPPVPGAERLASIIVHGTPERPGPCGPMPAPWPGMGVEYEVVWANGEREVTLTICEIIRMGVRRDDPWVAPGAYHGVVRAALVPNQILAIYDGRTCVWRRGVSNG